MATKTRQSLAQPDIQFGSEPIISASTKQKLDRLTQSVRALVAEVQKVQQAMAGGSTGEVLEKTGAGDYEAAWGAAATGTIVGAENIGPGDGLFADATADGILEFKSLIAGAHITLVEDTDSITIVGDTDGGGSGTVTSVGINSADLDVTGTPVTTSGSIALTIKPHAVTYPKMQETTTEAVVLGRRIAEGAGEIEELSAADLIAMGLAGAASSAAGSAGPPGWDGETGAEGFAGVPGPRGPKGEKGERGWPGEDGIPGEDGLSITGPKGDQGPVGLRGPPGEDGIPGEDGAQGIQGPIGPQGPAGASGSSGVPVLWFPDEPELPTSVAPFDTGASPMWAGFHTFTRETTFQATNPSFQLNDLGSGADQKRWRAIASAGAFLIDTRTDINGAGRTAIEVDRGTGVAIATITLGNATDNPLVNVRGSFEVDATNPSLQLNDAGSGADQKRWRAIASAGALLIDTRTDANGAGRTAMEIDRGTGVAVATITLGNSTDSPTINLQGSVKVLISGTEVFTIATTPTTGASTAAFSATNKPGATTGLGPSKWFAFDNSGTRYWIPAWTA